MSTKRICVSRKHKTLRTALSLSSNRLAMPVQLRHHSSTQILRTVSSPSGRREGLLVWLDRELQPTTPELEQAQLRLPDQRAPAFPGGAPP